ncbi:MAG TPA: twin-arginine translocase TatA/TatE family subunit [Flavobacteriales bacterium]|jgi:sec-independent protein translocase protein TatA|nr:twin-arginine translocase TatA/TatE family subunit [Flavobacteriales bacterium]HPH81498.1 twin-arginine translocase TatA/TatE family subunit [Flavobacteriales bacterium]
MIQGHIFLGALGPSEIILIGAGILLLFGGKKIPELMKGLGQGMREFKDAKDGKTELPEANKEKQTQINS